MAIITNRSRIGPEATFLVDGTDRSDWIMEISYDVNPNTADDTPLHHEDQNMIHVDRTTSGRIVWRTLSDAMAYMNTWVLALNDQRTLKIRAEGDGSRKPETTIEAILTSDGRNITRDAIQTMETSFHGNSINLTPQA